MKFVDCHLGKLAKGDRVRINGKHVYTVKRVVTAAEVPYVELEEISGNFTYIARFEKEVSGA